MATLISDASREVWLGDNENQLARETREKVFVAKFIGLKIFLFFSIRFFLTCK